MSYERPLPMVTAVFLWGLGAGFFEFGGDGISFGVFLFAVLVGAAGVVFDAYFGVFKSFDEEVDLFGSELEGHGFVPCGSAASVCLKCWGVGWLFD